MVGSSPNHAASRGRRVGAVVGFVVIVISIAMALDNAERIVVRTVIVVALFA
jgi:hypothetical protein